MIIRLESKNPCMLLFFFIIFLEIVRDALFQGESTGKKILTMFCADIIMYI